MGLQAEVRLEVKILSKLTNTAGAEVHMGGAKSKECGKCGIVGSGRPHLGDW
jgi:hypothetical protein